MFYRLLLLLLVSLHLLACAGNKLDSEQEVLEKPPRLVDFSTYHETYPSHQNNAQTEEDGVVTKPAELENFDVLLTKQAGLDTTLSIVQAYDKSWLMVAKALQHDAFDVTDRDRDAGIFYVSYDPDYQKSTWEKTSSFFLGEAGLISDFQLKLTDIDTITEITAELVVDEDLDDGAYADPDGEVEKFLLKLYKIMRVQ